MLTQAAFTRRATFKTDLLVEKRGAALTHVLPERGIYFRASHTKVMQTYIVGSFPTIQGLESLVEWRSILGRSKVGRSK